MEHLSFDRRRFGPVAAAVLIVLLLAAACTGGGVQAPTKGDIVVYVAVPLSGFQANAGQTVLGGVRLKAAEINAQGGLMGYRVVVEALDDESDSDVAVAVADQVAQEVTAGKAVLGVVGHLNSGQTLAAMEIYKDLGIVVITPTASEVSLTQKGYANFFRINANDAVRSSKLEGLGNGDLKEIESGPKPTGVTGSTSIAERIAEILRNIDARK